MPQSDKDSESFALCIAFYRVLDCKFSFSGEWVEPDLEGNILHQDEWSMSSTPPHFHLLNVLLISLLVQVMSQYLKTTYHPSFIQAYLSYLKSKSKIICCIRISSRKAIIHQSYKTILDLQDPEEPSRIKHTEFCEMPRYLDPSTI